MKYKRMFCWLRHEEKKELKEAVNSRFPLAFAKNYEDFREQIKKDDYLVISMTKISIFPTLTYMKASTHHPPPANTRNRQCQRTGRRLDPVNGNRQQFHCP